MRRKKKLTRVERIAKELQDDPTGYLDDLKGALARIATDRGRNAPLAHWMRALKVQRAVDVLRETVPEMLWGPTEIEIN